MDDILEFVVEDEEGTEKDRVIRLGIRIRIGDHETFCPISGPIGTEREWNTEIQRILSSIENLSKRGKSFFEHANGEQEIDLPNDLSPEELWSRLSQLEIEDHFVRTFNKLDSARRREVAEYVLTTCNVFSGRAAVFSARYDDKTGSLV
jgi:hypothetical protein